MTKEELLKELERYQQAFTVQESKINTLEVRLASTMESLNHNKGKVEVYKEIIKILINELRRSSDDY